MYKDGNPDTTKRGSSIMTEVAAAAAAAAADAAVAVTAEERG